MNSFDLSASPKQTGYVDAAGNRLSVGDRVIAQLRRFERIQIDQEIYERGKELPAPDLVAHSGVIFYADFGFSVRLDQPDDLGVIARRMDSDHYIYSQITPSPSTPE